MNNYPKSYVVTDYKILRQIQRLKYRRLLLPIFVILLVLIIAFFLRGRDILYYPLLLITMAAISWYGYVMTCFRTKGKINETEPASLLIPIEGKIKSLRSNEEIHSIRITKAFLDVIEIRAPMTGSFSREGENLIVETDEGKIYFLFHGDNITWFDDPEPIAGKVIGIIIGRGTCTINLPAAYQPQVADGQIVFGGETIICSLKTAVS